jgi:hypothetical protein
VPALYGDMTAGSGVDFTYHNGEEAGHYAILESLGGGVALLDYDGDGLLDIFLTGGGYFDGPEKMQIKGHPCKLYKNLGNWKFRDVTQEVGLDRIAFYTHGAAVADYDNDGWPDLFVTGWGGVALFHNEMDGKGGRHFVDVTQKGGLTEPLWSTSAAWADLDGDGYPDLYVCQYVNWSLDKNNPVCGGYASSIRRDICPPKTFMGLAHQLYHNNADGTFTNVSKEAGLRPSLTDRDKADAGKGLGVVIADMDGDGKPDIYVANDTVDNFLYLNKSTLGKLLFDEVGLPTGVARDDRGIPNGSKGLDVGDYDGSGKPSLWVTNYEYEMHALYRNLGGGMFLFSTPASGIASIGQTFVGWGTGFLDLDGDGWEDLVIANGHVIRHPFGASGRPVSPRQRPVLLRNNGKGRFVDITPQGGVYFRSKHLGRGLVIGDLDNDGHPDLVISHLNEPVVLLRNQLDVRQHWLGVELRGKNGRDVTGARVVVQLGERKLTRFAKGGDSYLSSGDRRLLFGLGQADHIKRLTVFWPWGEDQQWTGKELGVDHYAILKEGHEAVDVRRKAIRALTPKALTEHP